MVINRSPVMTVEDYFEWELKQERKHEYIDGEVIEMPGVSNKQSLIAVNVMLAIGQTINRSRFTLHTSEMRVQVSPNRYVYPDFSIVCGQPVFRDASEYNLMNPCFVLEVTSPSSATRNRGEKLEYYLSLPSIEATLIVDQDRVFAELYTRSDTGWQRQAFAEMDDVISLAMLNCELPLAEIYRGIAFEAL